MTAKLKQANLATKADLDDFVETTDFDNKVKDLNEKVPSNKIKHIWARIKYNNSQNISD